MNKKDQNPFKVLKRTKKKGKKTAKFNKRTGLDDLLQAAEDFAHGTILHISPKMTLEEVYGRGVEHTDMVKYSLDDIKDLCTPNNLKEYDDMVYFSAMGIFISAAYNKIADNTTELELDFGEYGKDIWYLGHSMKKGKITINSEIGSNLGFGMYNGEIIVNGNSYDHAGQIMVGGNITIHGNTGNNTGHSMSNGKIIVDGDAGNECGYFMSGGVIRVGGSIQDKGGKFMLGGRLLTKSAGRDLGHGMRGGHISVQEKIETVSTWKTGGYVFHKNKCIFPNR